MGVVQLTVSIGGVCRECKLELWFIKAGELF